jgi:acylphosphatase
MNKMVRAHITVEGRVQGVSFGAGTVEAAMTHGVRGWVRNNPNGAVEAVLEGDEESVNRLIEWCRTGPPMARVERLSLNWEPFKDEFDDFTALTRYTAY